MRSKILSKSIKTRTSPAFAIARNLYARFFWLPLVYTIFLIVFAATYLPYTISRMRTEQLWMPAEQVWSSLLSTVSYEMIFTYFVAILVSTFFGCTLFSYLNHTASTGFLHALPVRRGKIYLTYWLTGLSLILLPPVLAALFLLTVLRAGAAFTFLWLALTVLYSAVVFSGAVMVSLLSGNTVGSIAFTVFAIFLPAITEGFLDMFLQRTVYGRPESYLSFVSQWFYLQPKLLIGPRAWIYVVYTVLFFLAGLLLFKKRQMENAGNLIAFPRFRAFALYICALIVGMIAYLLFDANKYMFLVFGVLAVIVINFPMRKRFTLKGAILPALALVVTSLAVFAIVRFDLTGYERYLPEAKDVAEVRIGQSEYSMYMYEPRTEMRDGVEVMCAPELEGFKTQGDVENAIALHHYLIEQKGREVESEGHTLYYEYILKNGKHKTRVYEISLTQDAEEIRTVLESETVRAYQYSFLRPGMEVTSMELDNQYTGAVTLTAEETEKVLAALREDVLARRFERDPTVYHRRTEPCAYIEYKTRRIEASRGETKPQTADVPAASIDHGSDYVYLYADCEKTRALLVSMGYGEYLTLPGDLPEGAFAELARYGGGKYYGETSYTLPAADYTEEMVVVTDPEDVLSLMKFFEDASNENVTEEQRRSDLRYSVRLTRDGRNDVYLSLDGPESALEALFLKYKR